MLATHADASRLIYAMRAETKAETDYTVKMAEHYSLKGFSQEEIVCVWVNWLNIDLVLSAVAKQSLINSHSQGKE